jgi:PKD repeat protein
MKTITLFFFGLCLLITEKTEATTYYLKVGGTVTSVASWGTNTNGTGTAPINFTTANQVFNIRNNASVTLTAGWTVSGTGSGVTIGDGSTACNFTVPATAANKLTGSVLNVYANATLTLQNNTLPTLTSCVFDPASTVNFANSANTTIPVTNGSANSGVYGTLLISGTGTTYSFLGAAAGATTYTIGTLNVSTANTVEFNGGVTGATSYSFTITNYTQTNGTIDGGANNATDPGGNAHPINAYVYILGTFNKTGGTLTDNSPNNISEFIFAGGGTQSVSISPTTAGTNTWWAFRVSNNTTVNLSSGFDLSGGFTSGSQTYLTVDAGSTFNAGTNLISTNSTSSTTILLINGILQTANVNGLNGSTSTTLVSTNTPSITIGAASTIIYNSTSTQTVTARTDYANLTLTNSNKTLAGACTVAAAYTQTNGIVNLNGQTLTLNGIQTFPASLANGSFTGSAASNLIISGTGITNPLFFTSGSQTLNNFTLSSSAAQTLVLGTPLTVSGAFKHTSALLSLNSQTLTLNGAITFPTAVTNGSFTGSSTSILNIGGTGAITNSMFMTQTNSSANSMQDITLNRTGQTLTLGNALRLIGTLTPTLGTFASAGNLTLIASSATVSARIATIGGSVTGNVTVQSYAAGGNTGWVLMGSAGITGRTFADWNDNFAITCANCPNGAYVGGVAFTSIYSYVETIGGLFDNSARYIPITNTTNSITVGQGYWVYLGNATVTSSDIIYDVTGPVNQGNFTYNLTVTNTGGGTNAIDHGYNLLANPYPSPISWTSLRNGNTNVSNAIYVYNPDLNGYASYVNGVSSPAVGSGGMGDLIPAGQGFFVQATAATTLVAKETYKSASNQQLLKMASSSVPMVFRLKASGSNMQNETAIYFDTNAAMHFEDTYDALSLGVDAGFLGIVSSLNDTDYAINGLPALTQNFSIPVKATSGTTDTYQIAATDLQNLPSGACIMLHDNYLNADWDLRIAPYSCTITDTENVARFVLNITIDPTLSVISSFHNPTCVNSANGYIIASAANTASYNYYWKDSTNNIIQTALNKNGTDTLKNLQSGNYSVDVNTVGSCNNGTNTFTLKGPTANALFIPSASAVILTNDTADVTFANTSSNATSYSWNFGDGTTASGSNVMHPYTMPGNYTVTLTAYNQACGDSSVYSQVITVDASATGIKTFSANENNMQIDRDASGYYVQFNYSVKTNAVISVQNLLGEKVIADSHQEHVSSDKTYVSLGNAGNNVLIISVVTDAGEKIFRKVVNY